MDSQVSAEYAQALADANEATRKFIVIRDAFRARQIDVPEFLAAQDVHKLAQTKFDVAFAKESA